MTSWTPRFERDYALDVPEENLRATAAAVHSDRIRAMWASAGGVLSGEREVAGVGYTRMRPYLHGLHLKDVHVLDGPRGEFEWRPRGDGEVDYPALARRLIDHEGEVFLGCGHPLPAAQRLLRGSDADQFLQILSLIEQARSEADRS